MCVFLEECQITNAINEDLYFSSKAVAQIVIFYIIRWLNLKCTFF